MDIIVNTDFINTIITSIITSGIIGVFISEYYQRKTLVKKMKRDFVIELFANRYMLKESYLGDGNELNRSLGKIPIIFSDNEEVINCYDNLLSVFLIGMMRWLWRRYRLVNDNLLFKVNKFWYNRFIRGKGIIKCEDNHSLPCFYDQIGFLEI